MLPDGRRTICMTSHMAPELNRSRADPTQQLTTAAQDQDDLDHHLSGRAKEQELEVRVIGWLKQTASSYYGRQ